METGDLRIGLVLSGGGAKGAYQTGVFHALEDAGLADHITAISGCSIGAYNGLLYSIGGTEILRDYMIRFPALMEAYRQTEDAVVEESKQAVARGGVSLSQFETDSRFWKYGSDGLMGYVRSALAEYDVSSLKRRLYACSYSLERERPEYFCLNRLSKEEIAKVVVSSGTLPYVFPPVKIGDSCFTDGAVMPEICKAPAPSDKIPLRPLMEEPLNVIISVFLKPHDQIDHAYVPEHIRYLELRPSIPLEPAPSAGTMDFNPEHLKEREEIGYRDTLELLKKNPLG